MALRLLSNLDLETQIDANGATWIARELVSPNRAPFRLMGEGERVSGVS